MDATRRAGSPHGKNTLMSADSPDMRVSDVERDQVATLLSQHVALGRLTLSELEGRLDVAYTARTRGQLDVVLSDLPTAENIHAPAPETPSPRRSWPPWALTGTICLLVWLASSLTQGHPVDFWPIWVIGPWGVMILARTVPRHDEPASPPGTPRQPRNGRHCPQRGSTAE